MEWTLPHGMDAAPAALLLSAARCSGPPPSSPPSLSPSYSWVHIPHRPEQRTQARAMVRACSTGARAPMRPAQLPLPLPPSLTHSLARPHTQGNEPSRPAAPAAASSAPSAAAAPSSAASAAATGAVPQASAGRKGRLDEDDVPYTNFSVSRGAPASSSGAGSSGGGGGGGAQGQGAAGGGGGRGANAEPVRVRRKQRKGAHAAHAAPVALAVVLMTAPAWTRFFVPAGHRDRELAPGIGIRQRGAGARRAAQAPAGALLPLRACPAAVLSLTGSARVRGCNRSNRSCARPPRSTGPTCSRQAATTASVRLPSPHALFCVLEKGSTHPPPGCDALLHGRW